jgi:hypothetical protein
LKYAVNESKVSEFKIIFKDEFNIELNDEEAWTYSEEIIKFYLELLDD